VGPHGLGIGVMLYIGNLWLLDKALAKREMKRLDAVPVEYVRRSA
jgi:hypothetical protein